MLFGADQNHLALLEEVEPVELVLVTYDDVTGLVLDGAEGQRSQDPQHNGDNLLGHRILKGTAVKGQENVLEASSLAEPRKQLVASARGLPGGGLRHPGVIQYLVQGKALFRVNL